MAKRLYYRADDKMGDLICDNYALLQVMSRFGLSLGFGDHTVKEVCQRNNVDCDTFLSVVNFVIEENEYTVNNNLKISIHSLMNYLKEAHNYFIDYQLPLIKEKLSVFLKDSDAKVSLIIIKFFDAYFNEVREHMLYEDKYVFTYAEKLLAGEVDKSFNFSEFARKHDQVDSKLAELRDIIIKYLPVTGDKFYTNSLLFEIFACIEDLDSHGRVEDCIFVPAVLNLVREMEGK